MSERKRLDTQINRGVAWTAASQAIDRRRRSGVALLVVALFDDREALRHGDPLAVAVYTMLDNAADLGVTSSLIQRDDHTPERVSTVFWFNMLVSGALLGVLLLLGAALRPLCRAMRSSAGWSLPTAAS